MKRRTQIGIQRSYLVLCYAFLYIPLLILISFSFLDNHQHDTLTMQWYAQLLQDPTLLGVAGNSLFVAIFASTFATILGTFASVIIFRYKFSGRKLLNSTIFTLIVLPDIVMGISLLLLMHMLNVPLGFITLAIGHITLCLPFVAITINSRLVDMDTGLFDAARDLGATEFTIFWRIILPQLIPAIVAAWLMSFTLSMDDVIISFFLTGPDFQVLPLYIFSMVRLGITPEINALCSIIFFVTLILIFGAQWGIKKK
jgi:spermidine/putrescine transport system permease protein